MINNTTMECTQRLECTQDLYGSQRENIQPEQVGFVGINSTKYPVMKGPNKIGRDPSCSIVINQNCISRHHAVINVLNHNSFMIMDLDSTSKTKVYGKTLQPYIPQPLQNGDILQFGNVIGIFRLLEEEDDLPMTQAIDVPDTPIQPKFMSKTNSTHTTVPESPDVSDRDDSFIKASQPKQKQFKNYNVHFVKSSKTTIAIQPIGSHKIDNVFWNSSRKSESLHLSMNESTTEQPNTPNGSHIITETDIHEMDTQPTLPNSNKSVDSIHTAETQQINKENHDPDSIFSVNTQLPMSTQVCKGLNQNDVQLNLYASHEENDDSIFDAATQLIGNETEKPSNKAKETNNNKSGDEFNRSNDELEFEEIDNELLDECLESQSLITNEEMQAVSETVHNTSKIQNLSHTNKPSNPKIAVQENIIDDDSTDCEDDDTIMPNRPKSPIINSPTIDKKTKPTANTSKSNETCFEDMLTQVIEEDEVLTQVIEKVDEVIPNNDVVNDDIEDLATQVIPEIDPINTGKSTIEQYSEEIISPFKMPSRLKKKPMVSSPKPVIPKNESSKETHDKYYQSTQEVMDDLCSQNKDSPPILKISKNKSKLVLSESPGSSGSEDKVNKFVTSLSKTQINNMIGVDPVDILNKSTDSSDIDCTPQKVKPLDIMDVELPNTQEIKESLSKYPNQNADEFSTDSEVEGYAEELCDPFLNKKKKKEINAKKNLNEEFKKFSPKAKRKRRPTSKLQECCEISETNRSKIDKQSPQRKSNADNKTTKESTRISKDDTKTSKNEREKRKASKLNLSEQSSKSTEKSKSSTRSTNSSRDKKRDNTNKIVESEISENRTTRNSRSKTKTVNTSSEKEQTKSKSRRDNSRNGRSENTSSERENKRSDKSHKEHSFKIPNAPESRSTRSRNKDNKSEVTKKRDESPVKVRRSKRQTKTNETTELKSILKKSNDQSIVYNESIISNEELRVLKRPAVTYSNGPNSKRSKVEVSSGLNLRSTPARNVKTQYVLFTAFANDEVKAKLEKLGAVIVTDIHKCTVVLTHQIKRTFKLLCVVGLGRPIVGPNWVQACADNDMIVDPWLYLLKDETAEKRFGFSLHRTLTGRRNFLKGYNVFSTPSVMPNATEMKLIVECSGGNWKEGGRNWICVSSMADKHIWASCKKRGAILVSTEFILQGVLQQKVNINGTALPVDD